MRKITEEEYQKLTVKGRGRSSAVFTAILNMKPGEILVIEKADWKKRYTPSRLSSYIGKKYGHKLKTVSIADGKGWVVRRLE